MLSEDSKLEDTAARTEMWVDKDSCSLSKDSGEGMGARTVKWEDQ
jgi:hypothetical protein